MSYSRRKYECTRKHLETIDDVQDDDDEEDAELFVSDDEEYIWLTLTLNCFRKEMSL